MNTSCNLGLIRWAVSYNIIVYLTNTGLKTHFQPKTSDASLECPMVPLHTTIISWDIWKYACPSLMNLGGTSVTDSLHFVVLSMAGLQMPWLQKARVRRGHGVMNEASSWLHPLQSMSPKMICIYIYIKYKWATSKYHIVKLDTITSLYHISISILCSIHTAHGV